MFWVGLATLILVISGAGDDTRSLRMQWEAMRKLVTEHVSEGARARQTITAIDGVEQVVYKHRARLALIGSCLEKADRNYHATEADYLACQEDLRPAWEHAVNELISAERGIRTSLKKEEFDIIIAELKKEQN